MSRPFRWLDLVRKISVYCPRCGGPMRRTGPGRSDWWACKRLDCPGTRGKPSEFVESRQSWQAEYGDYESRKDEVLLKFSLIHPHLDLRRRPLSILDFGCAYGHYLRYLKAQNPAHRLYGVDIAKHVVETLSRDGLADAVYWQGCDQPLPFGDGSLDMVYSFDTLEHVPNPEALDYWFGEVARVLKPEGRFFIFIPNFHLKTRLCMLVSGEFMNVVGGDHCFMLTSRDVDGFLRGDSGRWSGGSSAPYPTIAAFPCRPGCSSPPG
ncbi:class I SAM-dependent methyltransferase [bacterium]|nr:class I SAM-dependent methyltransferase [bacterium]